MSALKKAQDFVVAAVGIWLVSRIVSPRNNAAQIIGAMTESYSRMLKIATAETCVGYRMAPRFGELLGEMDDPTMTELFAGLSDTDLDWVEEMLRDA